MLINSLYNYYSKLVEDPYSEVAPEGYSKAKVTYALNISKDGVLLDIVDLKRERGEKLISPEMLVPEQGKRTGNVKSYFLCENSKYIFGVGTERDKSERLFQTYRAFEEHHKEMLEGIDDDGARAVLAFLEKRKLLTNSTNEDIVNKSLEDIIGASNFIFRLDGSSGYIHERQAIREAWRKHDESKESGYTSQCLVTGKVSSIPNIHNSIKGVRNSQSTGAALVSINFSAAESYGKTQNYNSPIGDEAAFAYVTALNWLLKSEKNKIQIGDCTTVFWAEERKRENLIKLLLSPEIPIEDDKDNKTVSRNAESDIFELLKKVRDAKPLKEWMTEFDEGTKYYILGLSPNNSRLAVRFWHMDTLGGLVQKVGQHYRDMELEAPKYRQGREFVQPWEILYELAPQRDMKKLPNTLIGGFMRSLLNGSQYPQAVFSGIIERIRANDEGNDPQGSVNYVRTSFIKAYLSRKARIQKKQKLGVNCTVSLNEQSTNTAYCLGRLFAVLERAQEDANPGINSTIRDRYFASASATPNMVFPILLRLAQHHISKSDYGNVSDMRISKIMQEIETFPAHLTLDEQGLFMLGYYHQREAFYTKKNKEEV